MYAYKFLLGLEFVALVFLVGAVTLAPADKAEAEQEKITHTRDVVRITEESRLDFSGLDAENYYYGLIDNDAYIYKVERLFEDGFSGVYYAVDSSSQWLNPEKFKVRYHDKELVFSAQDSKIELEFDILMDSLSVTGSFEDKSDLLGPTHHIAFKRYNEPSFTVCDNDRFEKESFKVEVKKDVKYGHAKGFWASYQMKDDKYLKMLLKNLGKTITPKELDLTLDLYLPKDDTIKEHPLFVLMHGGSFYFGDKGDETMRLWCEHFASTGYVVASANYRMGFMPNKAAIQRCGYEAIQDANAVMRYLIHHAKTYGIDTNNVFVGGTSAGSITMLSMAFMTDNNSPDFVKKHKYAKRFGGLTTAGNDIKQSFKIKAIANMWGAIYDLDQISSRPTPVISFHGDADVIVPFDCGIPFSAVKGNIGEMLFDTMYGSKSIHQRLDSLRIRNEFYPLLGKSHSPYVDGNDNVNEVYYFIQNKMQAFFLKEMKRVGQIYEVSKVPLQYGIKQEDVAFVNWKVEGGFILQRYGNNICVVWRSDAPHHSITASGCLKNGTPFLKEKKISKNIKI